MHQSEEQILTVDEAAALLKVTTRTIRSWVAKRQIPFFRLNGRMIRFRRSSLLAWAEDLERRETGEAA